MQKFEGHSDGEGGHSQTPPVPRKPMNQGQAPVELGDHFIFLVKGVWRAQPIIKPACTILSQSIVADPNTLARVWLMRA